MFCNLSIDPKGLPKFSVSTSKLSGPAAVTCGFCMTSEIRYSLSYEFLARVINSVCDKAAKRVCSYIINQPTDICNRLATNDKLASSQRNSSMVAKQNWITEAIPLSIRHHSQVVYTWTSVPIPPTMITGLGKKLAHISFVPRPHPLTRKNGLVNQVKLLGLVHTLALCVT